jgi:hypothetical protein
MEDFTLPSVGGSLKKWVHYAPILPKPPGLFPKLLKKNFTKKNFKKIKTNCIESGVGPRPAGDRWSPAGRGWVPEPSPVQFFFNSSYPPFFPHVVNSFSLVPAHALPIVHLETSNTHNF